MKKIKYHRMLDKLFSVANSCNTMEQINSVISWGREVLINHGYRYQVSDFMEYTDSTKKIIELSNKGKKLDNEIKFLTTKKQVVKNDIIDCFDSFIIKNNHTVAFNLLVGLVTLNFKDKTYTLLQFSDKKFKVTRFNEDMPKELKIVLFVWDKKSFELEKLSDLTSDAQRKIHNVIFESFN